MILISHSKNERLIVKRMNIEKLVAQLCINFMRIILINTRNSGTFSLTEPCFLNGQSPPANLIGTPVEGHHVAASGDEESDRRKRTVAGK